MKKKYSLIFIIISVSIMLVALFFAKYALTHKPSDYKLSFIGYGGTFNRKKTGVDKWIIQPYWLMYIIGITGMCILCIFRRLEIEIKIWQAFSIGILLAVFGYLGAKGLYRIENYKYVKENGIKLSGTSFFGSVFIMLLAIPLIKRILLIKTGDLLFMDFCTPAGVLMLACVRIGCFMNGCCRGIGRFINDKPLVYPVQLIESSLDFLILGILMSERVRIRFKNRLIFLFMISYGVVRYILEAYRNTSKTDNIFIKRSHASNLNELVPSNGQIFAIISAAIGIVMLIVISRRNRGKANITAVF